jgi:hypothetical protein
MKKIAMSRIALKFAFAALVALAASDLAHAASCTTQAAMLSADRDALAAAGNRLAAAAAAQDFTSLKDALLPAVAGDWENIRAIVEQSASLLKGGQVQLNNLYLLDASTLSAPADTQFFCSNANGSITVTINMHSLPPGRYALVLGEIKNSPYHGQFGIILAWDQAAPNIGWKMGGITIHPGALGGNDGLWYWVRARELARADSTKYDPWSAYYSYEVARALLVPVDFLSSPNLDKLEQEEAQIKNSPQQGFPLTLNDGPRSFKVEAVQVDPVLLQPDLAVLYEANSALTDAAAQRTEAIAVLSALLKTQPALRQNFHGLWAYSVKDGKRTPVLELPMEQIP